MDNHTKLGFIMPIKWLLKRKPLRRSNGVSPHVLVRFIDHTECSLVTVTFISVPSGLCQALTLTNTWCVCRMTKLFTSSATNSTCRDHPVDFDWSAVAEIWLLLILVEGTSFYIMELNLPVLYIWITPYKCLSWCNWLLVLAFDSISLSVNQSCVNLRSNTGYHNRDAFVWLPKIMSSHLLI